jgi:hypothetical protein
MRTLGQEEASYEYVSKNQTVPIASYFLYSFTSISFLSAGLLLHFLL